MNFEQMNRSQLWKLVKDYPNHGMTWRKSSKTDMLEFILNQQQEVVEVEPEVEEVNIFEQLEEKNDIVINGEKMPMRNLLEFLEDFKCDESGESNIWCHRYGRYNIPDNHLNTFFDLLDECRKSGVFTHFMEGQNDPSGIMLDIDIRQDCSGSQITTDHIYLFIEKIFKILLNHLDTPIDEHCGVIRKTPELIGEYYKDGFHILIPGLKVSRKYKKYLVKFIKESTIMDIFDWEIIGEKSDILDMGSSSVPVNFIGSCPKHKRKAYDVFGIFRAEVNKDNCSITEVDYKNLNLAHEFSLNFERKDGIVKKREYKSLELNKSKISDNNITAMDMKIDDEQNYQIFPCLYPNDKYPNQSVAEKIDLKEFDGHILRNAEDYKFYVFESIPDLGNWFYSLARPQIHSVINRYRPVRFNVELDIDYGKLDNITLSQEVMTKLNDADIKVNLIKYQLVVKHTKKIISQILEEEYDIFDVEFYEASDNRAGKYSHRLYSDIAFANLREYKHFCKLLKSKVREDVAPMIDPTSLMLRTPDSWKDDHRCRWKSNGSDISHAILTNTEECKMLIEIAPEDVSYDKKNIDNKEYATLMGIIFSHNDVKNIFTPSGQKDNFIPLRRLAPSHCKICNKEHDSIDGYVWIYKNSVYLGCYNSRNYNPTTKGTFLGYIGEKTEFPTSWASLRSNVKSLMGKDNLTGSEIKKQTLTLDEMVRKAKQNDIELTQRKFTFDDFKHIHGKTFSDCSPVTKYVDESIFRIVKGGQNFWISKSKWKKQTHFTEIKNAPFATKSDSIKFDIINPEFDPEQPPSKDNQMTLGRDLFEVMTEHRKIHFHKSVDFMPSLTPIEEDGDIFNLFEGYRYQYTQTDYKDVPQSIQPWINHIKEAICSGDATLARIVTQWFAHIIQKPQKKCYSLIILGKEGTGKSLLYDIFRQCIGEALAIQLSKLSDLTQTHNKIVQGRLLVNCNEATNYPSIADVNIVKQFVTDKEFLINPKCCPLYMVNNFARLLITTNCRFPMRVTPDDRRYCCIEMSDKYKGNDEYFNKLAGMLNDENALSDLFNYLANFDLSDFKFNRPVMTPFKRELIGECMDDTFYWIKEIFEEGLCHNLEIKDEIVETTRALYNYYTDWCDMTLSRKLKQKDWKLEIKKYGFEYGQFRVGVRANDKRIRGWKLSRVVVETNFKNVLNDPEFKFNQN